MSDLPLVPPALLSEVDARFRTMADHAPVLLWMAGTDGLCHFFNQGWLAFTGRTLAEEFGNGWAEGVHPEDFQRCMHTYLDAFVARRAFNMEYRLRRRDGAYRWIFDQGAPRFEVDGSFAGYIGSCVDVTEQREARDALERMNDSLEELVRERTALAEGRRVLLREVHHRVKNDLQLISSMLSLQGRALLDPAAKAALGDCQSRVLAVALIHEHVYRSEEFARLRFAANARSIANGVFRLATEAAGPIALEVDADEDIELTVERAIPCGLILGELVTNALKHAFPEGRRGMIRVTIAKEGAHHARLAVSDDGVGIPHDRGETSLGWSLVRAFAEQLAATIEVNRDSGTTVSMVFALDP